MQGWDSSRSRTALVTALLSAWVSAGAEGGAAVRGDFDGDGFADLAIGAPFEDVDGKENAGVVHVIYGSANGPDSSGSQLWHENVTGIEDKCEKGDRFGAALVAGDFDGDGIDDLVVGVPGESGGTGQRKGAFHIFWGDAGGLTAAEETYRQIAVSISQGPQAEPLEGASALAAGDFNNDGFDDLAVGVPGESTFSASEAGAVQIFRGDTLRNIPNTPASFTQATSGVRNAPDDGDRFGSALAAGDFDNDGFSDLAIGVPGETIGGAPRAGAVSVLYGRVGGLSGAGDQFLTQENLHIGGGSERKDRFGSTLATGDFNNDGFADLAMGAPLEDRDGAGPALENTGSVIVIYGSAAELDAATAEEWTQNTGGVSNGADTGDQFGAALAAGDFDNDGRDDLAIGAPFEGIGGVEAGAVHVLYGSAGGLNSNGDQFWHQDRDGLEGAANAGDRFGAALGALDFDGDGFADLAIGIPGEKVDGGEGAGAVAVLFGDNSGLVSADNQLWTQESAGIGDSPNANDGFGSAVGD